MHNSGSKIPVSKVSIQSMGGIVVYYSYPQQECSSYQLIHGEEFHHSTNLYSGQPGSLSWLLNLHWLSHSHSPQTVRFVCILRIYANAIQSARLRYVKAIDLLFPKTNTILYPTLWPSGRRRWATARPTTVQRWRRECGIVLGVIGSKTRSWSGGPNSVKARTIIAQSTRDSQKRS